MAMEKIYIGLVVGIVIALLTWALLRQHREEAPPAPPPVEAKHELMYFGASWCAPCRQMKKTLSDADVSVAMKQIRFASYDIDKDKKRAAEWNVSAVPTYILLDPAGKELRRASGYKTPGEFIAWLKGG